MEELIGAIFWMICRPLLLIVALVFEVVFSLAGHVFMACLIHLFAIPVCCILFTPFVLVGAFFEEGSYVDNVLAGYKTVCINVIEFSGRM